MTLLAGLHRRPGADPDRLAAELGGICVHDDAELDRLLSQPSVSVRQIDDLLALAAVGEAAARVATRTHDRAAHDVLARRGEAGAQLTLHATAFRRAAEALLVARARVAAARAALPAAGAVGTPADEAGEPVPPAQRDDRHRVAEAPVALAPSGAEHSDRRSHPPAVGRRLWAMALGPIVAVAVVGVLGAVFGAVPLWLALLPVMVACVVVLHLLRPTTRAAPSRKRPAGPARPRPSARAVPDPPADGPPGGGLVAGPPGGGLVAGPPGGGDPDTAAARAAVAVAEEEWRLAEQAWRALAGPDADPARCEEVLRARDPQYRDARRLAEEGPAVRATSVLVESIDQRWASAWTALGRPPPLPIRRQAVDELAAAATRPIVLSARVSGHADAVRAMRPRAPVVVTGPGDDPDAEVPTGDGDVS